MKVFTSEEVKRANLEVYNQKTWEGYQENRSIFHPKRQRAIQSILQELKQKSGGDCFLDVGCGTGNLLELAQGLFRRSVGLDLAYRLLQRVRGERPRLVFVAGDAEKLPFRERSFDVISLYAVLHHILDSTFTMQEVLRCLKPGGFLYTDHDPNYFFNRFYHLYYRVRYRSRPGFGSELEEVAEYHNTKRGGINPEILGDKLRGIGFQDVCIHYRHTDNDDLFPLARYSLRLMEWLARIFPFRSLYTHFWITAQKAHDS